MFVVHGLRVYVIVCTHSFVHAVVYLLHSRRRRTLKKCPASSSSASAMPALASQASSSCGGGGGVRVWMVERMGGLNTIQI